MKNRFLQYIFCIVFIGIGIFALYQASWEYINGSRSKNWPTTEAEVMESKIDYSRGRSVGKKGSFTPKIVYAYAVNNSPYKNDRIRFGAIGMNTHVAAENIIKRYPKGKTMTIFYKEADPALSVIEPGVSDRTYIFLVIGVTFFLFGCLALFVDLEKEAARTRLKIEKRTQREQVRKKEQMEKQKRKAVRSSPIRNRFVAILCILVSVLLVGWGLGIFKTLPRILKTAFIAPTPVPTPFPTAAPQPIRIRRKRP